MKEKMGPWVRHIVRVWNGYEGNCARQSHRHAHHHQQPYQTKLTSQAVHISKFVVHVVIEADTLKHRASHTLKKEQHTVAIYVAITGGLFAFGVL